MAKMKYVVAAVAAVVVAIADGAIDREFLKALISIPSETRSASECARAVEAYAGWLEARGVVCTVMTNGVGRKFLYAATTPGLEHDFVFVSHLDVVPAIDPAQFTPRIEGDIIHGRGACDTKGNAVVIAQVLSELVGKASVGAVISTDEEGGSGWRCGTSGYAIELGVRPRRMVLVGDSAGEEPGQLFVGEKGHVRITMTAHGKGGHSSIPWACDNPVTKVMRAAVKVLDAYPMEASAEDNWHNVLSPTVMRGSEAANIIPDSASVTFSFRFCNPGD
jgi:succinyl-diaminopimelate desuccinylase